MIRNFDAWLSTFKESISDYAYYVDFKTVVRNAKQLKNEIELMNTLIGSKDIEFSFRNLVNKHPEVLRCIPILISKREMNVFCMDEEGTFVFDFEKMNYSMEDYVKFMEKTGLFDLLQNQLSGHLYDYLLGVEAGLNSNGRKNRGGHLMENLVESFIKKAGFVKDQTYFKEMYLSDVEAMANLDLSTLSNSGSTVKRFDYVILGKNCVYACECNFYASSGSKLNETARSYKTLAIESQGIKGFKFAWFTDGVGWLSAKNNLKETFDVLDDIYCIEDLEQGILKSF